MSTNMIFGAALLAISTVQSCDNPFWWHDAMSQPGAQTTEYYYQPYLNLDCENPEDDLVLVRDFQKDFGEPVLEVDAAWYGGCDGHRFELCVGDDTHDRTYELFLAHDNVRETCELVLRDRMWFDATELLLEVQSEYPAGTESVDVVLAGTKHTLYFDEIDE